MRPYSLNEELNQTFHSVLSIENINTSMTYNRPSTFPEQSLRITDKKFCTRKLRLSIWINFLCHLRIQIDRKKPRKNYQNSLNEDVENEKTTAFIKSISMGFSGYSYRREHFAQRSKRNATLRIYKRFRTMTREEIRTIAQFIIKSKNGTKPAPITRKQIALAIRCSLDNNLI